LEIQAKDMGKWAAIENINTGELAVFTWSGDKVAKKIPSNKST